MNKFSKNPIVFLVLIITLVQQTISPVYLIIKLKLYTTHINQHKVACL